MSDPNLEQQNENDHDVRVRDASASALERYAALLERLANMTTS
jgi:hypothetical protein